MKKILIPTLLLFAGLTFSQNFSYGILLGGEYATTTASGGTTFSSENGHVNFRIYPGAYLEYNLTDNVGLKTGLALKNKQFSVFGDAYSYNFKILEFSPSFKYDFGHEYRKGFYLLAGPSLSFISKVEHVGENIADEFEKTSVVAQVGFGTRMLKYLDLEFKFDYGLTPFFKNEATGNNDVFTGASLSVGLDLERVIK